MRRGEGRTTETKTHLYLPTLDSGVGDRDRKMCHDQAEHGSLFSLPVHLLD